jgi:hypothetical protein
LLNNLCGSIHFSILTFLCPYRFDDGAAPATDDETPVDDVTVITTTEHVGEASAEAAEEADPSIVDGSGISGDTPANDNNDGDTSSDDDMQIDNDEDAAHKAARAANEAKRTAIAAKRAAADDDEFAVLRDAEKEEKAETARRILGLDKERKKPASTIVPLVAGKHIPTINGTSTTSMTSVNGSSMTASSSMNVNGDDLSNELAKLKLDMATLRAENAQLRQSSCVAIPAGIKQRPLLAVNYNFIARRVRKELDTYFRFPPDSPSSLANVRI